MSSSYPRNVILEKPSDWAEWMAIIRRRATEGGVFEHIDPSKGTQPTQLVEPAEITPGQVSEGMTTFDKMDDKQERKLRLLLELRRQNITNYHKKKDILWSLNNFVTESIARQHLLYIEKQDTVWAMLTALKKRLAPTDRAREMEVIAQYRALQRPNRNQKIDKWLLDWEKVYAEAQSLDLPDVQKGRPLDDFLNAVRAIHPGFADTKQAILEEKRMEGKDLPSLTDLLEQYRNFVRITRAASKSSTHTAFATFQGSSPDEEEKRATATPKEKKSCLCGELHRFRECPYLVERLRPTGWVADIDVQKVIDEKLANNPRLTKAVDYAKKSTTQKKASNKSDKANSENRVDGKSDDHSTHGSFVIRSAYSIELHEYKLKNCWTLDSGTDIHVCNDRSRFRFERPADETNVLVAGKDSYAIEAFGSVDINIRTPMGTASITLLNVALAPGFLTNLVCLRRFTEKGYHWDTENDRIHHKGKTFCYTTTVDDHWVLEYGRPQKETNANEHAAFATSRKPRADITASAAKWHAILGHPGPEAIEHLESAVEGAIIDGRGPTTTECETCSLSKAREIVSRRPEKEDPADSPLERIGYDLIQMSPAYNENKWISHFTDYSTTMDFVYCHYRKNGALEAIIEFLNMARTRYGKKVRYFRTDGEKTLGREFDILMISYGITVERSAPATPAQNGGAERAGRAIITKARSMRIAADLPADLWPETFMAAGYLNNRTPKRLLKWKTPYEALTGQRPQLTHLHPFGCRAYPLDKHIPKSQKLDPRAFIGYLVGYDSTNIYRIWVPSQGKVIRTRDVLFNDDQFYDPKELDLGHIQVAEEVVQTVQLPDSMTQAPLTEDSIASTDELDPPSNQTDTAPTDDSPQTMSERQKDTPEPPTMPLTPEITPEPSSRPAETSTEQTGKRKADRDVSLAQDSGNILPEGTKRNRKRREAYITAVESTNDLTPYHSSFSTGLAVKNPQRHRDSMPAEPKNWRQMLAHPYKAEWLAAAGTEVQELDKKGTYELQSTENANKIPLPLLWVFKYKFDTDGYLSKFKARLCVRGDLQTTEQDTYAATLAARTFRALMALAAAFDLEMRQYDAINAFINADMDEEIYCYCPEGFRRPGQLWRLRKALYGLKQSPLLWYQELTKVLEELGLHPVPGINCLYANESIILFFYVDDVVVLCRKQHQEKLRTFEEALLKRFEMRALGELQWFLGIRITRDRPTRKLWLCQDSYITKIANKFNLTTRTRAPTAPLPAEGVPLANEEAANPQRVYAYQQRVGSVNFPAVITRPDVAHASSQLARHLKNPSEQHVQVADRVISYMYFTRNLAIEFSGRQFSRLLMCYSDAAFGDDVETRRSSDGYLVQLYGGPIDWRAGRQATVTTSSTEAELLSLSTAAREAIWWRRFFKAIHFDTEQELTICCDNLQTIRMLETNAQKLSTRLRHVDIHGHWLRQEVQQGRIKLEWVPTAEMAADGLTKGLTKQKNDTFLRQLNLVDISAALVSNERSSVSSTTAGSGNEGIGPATGSAMGAATADPEGVCWPQVT